MWKSFGAVRLARSEEIQCEIELLANVSAVQVLVENLADGGDVAAYGIAMQVDVLRSLIPGAVGFQPAGEHLKVEVARVCSASCFPAWAGSRERNERGMERASRLWRFSRIWGSRPVAWAWRSASFSPSWRSAGSGVLKPAT